MADMLPIATLNGIPLPEQFSYRPYVPRKRKSVTATALAVVTQASEPWIVHGDGTLPWTIPSAFPAEFQAIFDLFNTTSCAEIPFLGYWGEAFQVIFDVLDQPQPRGRLFNLSGQFQVVSVTTEQLAVCGLIP